MLAGTREWTADLNFRLRRAYRDVVPDGEGKSPVLTMSILRKVCNVFNYGYSEDTRFCSSDPKRLLPNEAKAHLAVLFVTPNSDEPEQPRRHRPAPLIELFTASSTKAATELANISARQLELDNRMFRMEHQMLSLYGMVKQLFEGLCGPVPDSDQNVLLIPVDESSTELPSPSPTDDLTDDERKFRAKFSGTKLGVVSCGVLVNHHKDKQIKKFKARLGVELVWLSGDQWTAGNLAGWASSGFVHAVVLRDSVRKTLRAKVSEICKQRGIVLIHLLTLNTALIATEFLK